MNIDRVKERELQEKYHFDTLARLYETKYNYGNRFTKYKIEKKIGRFAKYIEGNFGKGKSLGILEIGCGTGAYTRSYASKLPKAKVIATDISGKIIEVAKSKTKRLNNIQYKVKSAYATQVKDQSIDVVCGFYVLHHVDIHEAMKEASRILKPGGLAYFYEPNILNPLVFILKSSKVLKKLGGDSSEEWGMNPFKPWYSLFAFRVVRIKTTEFVWPISFMPFKLMTIVDKISSLLCNYLPLVNLLGGSVEICLQKYNDKTT